MNYSEMSKIIVSEKVFCYTCRKKTNREYLIREMSRRAGNYLCLECHEKEILDNKALNRLFM